MSDLYGSHFEFAGKSSREYGLIIANIETNRVLQLSGSKTSVALFNKKLKKRYLITDDYANSPLSFDIEIITTDTRCLEHKERREIERWLFHQNGYCKFYLDMADDWFSENIEFVDGQLKRNYLNCRLINPERIECGCGICGYKATLEADSNMFWQDAIKKTFSVNNANKNSSSIITVNVDSDLNDYTYPKVTINLGGAGGDIILSNNSDNSSRLTKFVDIPPYATIVINGELNSVSDQYYEKFYKQNFPRLLNGENKLTIIGNVNSITLEFSNRRAL